MAEALKKTFTWLEVAVRRVGLTQAIRAMDYAYLWAVARESLHHDPSADEVATWWAENRRTIFREQAAFRQAFPELDGPGDIYDSPAARAALKKHADFGDRIEEWGKDRKRREREKGAVEAGSFPAHLPNA